MADPSLYEYPSPLEGYENLASLPNDIVTTVPGKKSNVKPQTGMRSKAYESFTNPIANGDKNGFDIHIYFNQANQEQTKFARDLWERIRREFPELRTYKIWEQPIGPHITGMFEVDLCTPTQFGAFIPWLVINRGPLSVLVHPNTGDAERDHSQRATWMGERLPLDFDIFRKMMGQARRPRS